MPVYDVDLVDDATSQEFSFRLEARDRRVAEKLARRRAQPERYQKDPLSPKASVPLRCMRLQKLARTPTMQWFRSRLEGEERWPEAGKFIKDTISCMMQDHPHWEGSRLTRSAWNAMMAAFPEEISMDSGQVRRLRDNKELIAKAEKKKGAQREQAANPDAGPRARLLRAALVKSDRGSIQDDTEWVYQNLDVPWDKIVVDSVPSPGAVALLNEAKANKPWFFQTYHAKTLPTKAKIESDGWLEADDGQIEEMAARVIDEMAEEAV